MLICACSVFEAFGKIRSCKLAPDMLRPGKHRQVKTTFCELFYSSYLHVCTILTVFLSLRGILY